MKLSIKAANYITKMQQEYMNSNTSLTFDEWYREYCTVSETKPVKQLTGVGSFISAKAEKPRSRPKRYVELGEKAFPIAKAVTNITNVLEFNRRLNGNKDTVTVY